MMPRVETGTKGMIKGLPHPGREFQTLVGHNVFGTMPWRRNTDWTGRGKFRAGSKVHSLREPIYRFGPFVTYSIVSYR